MSVAMNLVIVGYAYAYDGICASRVYGVDEFFANSANGDNIRGRVQQVTAVQLYFERNEYGNALILEAYTQVGSGGANLLCDEPPVGKKYNCVEPSSGNHANLRFDADSAIFETTNLGVSHPIYPNDSLGDQKIADTDIDGKLLPTTLILYRTSIYPCLDMIEANQYLLDATRREEGAVN